MKNGDTDTISDALKMFGDQDSAAKWFGHLNTKSDGRDKSHCIDQIRPLHLLACTSSTVPKTEAYFLCTFDLSNSI